ELHRHQLFVYPRLGVGVVQAEDPPLVAVLAAQAALQAEAPRRPHLRDAHAPPVAPLHQVDAPLPGVIVIQADRPDVAGRSPGPPRAHAHAIQVTGVGPLTHLDLEALAQSDYGRAVGVEADDAVAVPQLAQAGRPARGQHPGVGRLAPLVVAHEVLP